MRKAILLLTITLFTFATTTHAQPDSLWSRLYGGEQGDFCFSMIQTNDGGYALAGYTMSFDVDWMDFYIVKTDEAGDTIWTSVVEAGGDNICYCVIQTFDNGYVLSGHIFYFGRDQEQGELIIIKVNENGEELWTQTYDDFTEGSGKISMIQTADSSLVLTGDHWTHEDRYLRIVKFESNGEVIWQNDYELPRDVWSAALIATQDSGFAIACSDYSLFKTDNEGELEWSHIYDGRGYCNTLTQADNGGYVLAGTEGCLMEIDSEGEQIWRRYFNEQYVFYSIIRALDGGYALGGEINFRNPDVLLLKTDTAGEEIWVCSFGGEFEETCRSIIQTDDRSYLLAGFTGVQSYDGGDFLLVKTTPDTLPPDGIANPQESFSLQDFSLSSVFPNPFNSSTTITYGLPVASSVSLQLYDLAGWKVMTIIEGNRQAGIHRTMLSAAELPSGIYFVRLMASDQMLTQKVLLIK